MGFGGSIKAAGHKSRRVKPALNTSRLAGLGRRGLDLTNRLNDNSCSLL
jgi:hypothetical protein